MDFFVVNVPGSFQQVVLCLPVRAECLWGVSDGWRGGDGSVSDVKEGNGILDSTPLPHFIMFTSKAYIFFFCLQQSLSTQQQLGSKTQQIDEQFYKPLICDGGVCVPSAPWEEEGFFLHR